MTDNKAVMQQALDALEKVQALVNPQLSPEHKAWGCELTTAIAALQAAIAQPDTPGEKSCK